MQSLTTPLFIRQVIKHADRSLRFGSTASEIAHKCGQLLLLLIPMSKYQVAITFLELVTTSDFAIIGSHRYNVRYRSFPAISNRECDFVLRQSAIAPVAYRRYIAKKDSVDLIECSPVKLVLCGHEKVPVSSHSPGCILSGW